jgi:GAF domain-containing protein
MQVSPLDNQLIDVALADGQASFQQATESYRRMLDDAGTTDIRDDGAALMDEGEEFDHEERPASPEQYVGTARAFEESSNYDHLRIPQSAESTPMALNLTTNNVVVPVENETSASGELHSENAASKSLSRTRSDSINQRHARETFASGNRNASMKSSRSMQRTLVYHDIKTEAQTVTNPLSAVPAVRSTPGAASADGRTWSFMSKTSPGRQQVDNAKQNIDRGVTTSNHTASRLEESRPWSIEHVDECVICTFLNEQIGMTEVDLRLTLARDTLLKRNAILLRPKVIPKPVISTVAATKRPTTPLLPALRRVSKHESASNSGSAPTVSTSAARRVSTITTVLSPNIAVATDALPQMGRLPRVAVSGANAPSAATAALHATSKGAIVTPLLVIRPPVTSDGNDMNQSATSLGSVHLGLQSGGRLSGDAFPPVLSPITRGGSETYSVAEHVDIDAPNIDFSGHATPRAASNDSGGVEPSVWLSVPIPALDGADAVPVGAIVVSVVLGVGHLDANDRRVFDMIATSFAQTKRRIHQMQAAHSAQVRAFGLVEMVKAVSHEVETPEIISRIISVAYDLLQAERVSVFFVDHEKRELLLALSEDAAGFRLPISKGLVGTVAVSGRVLNIPDAYKHPAFDSSFDSKTGFVTRSVLAMPVKNPAGEVVAVIQALNKRNGGVFLDEDVRTLSVVADTAGVTLHKATLLQDAKVAKEASAALADVVRIANDVSKEDVESLTVKLVAVGYRLINAERITLFLVDELRNELYCQVSQDVEGLRTIRIPIGQGIAGNVASSGVPVNIANAYADARFDRSVDDKTGFKTRSILCVPVLSSHQHKTVAVIQAINKIGGPFSKADEQLLDAFCAEVGGLLDKISLQLAYDRVFTDESDDQHVVSSLLTQFVTADRGSHPQKLRTSNSARKLHSGFSTPAAGLSRVASEASLVSAVATSAGTPVSVTSATEQATSSAVASRRDSTLRTPGAAHAMHLMPIAPDEDGATISPSPLMRSWLQRVQSKSSTTCLRYALVYDCKIIFQVGTSMSSYTKMLSSCTQSGRCYKRSICLHTLIWICASSMSLLPPSEDDTGTTLTITSSQWQH